MGEVEMGEEKQCSVRRECGCERKRLRYFEVVLLDENENEGNMGKGETEKNLEKRESRRKKNGGGNGGG